MTLTKLKTFFHYFSFPGRKFRDICKIHIWHDNSGDDPSWFLEQVIIKDVNRGDTRYFLLIYKERSDVSFVRLLKRAAGFLSGTFFITRSALQVWLVINFCDLS